MPWRKGNKLPLLSEAQASDAVREIYFEVRARLAVSFTPTLYQAYGNYPQFLAEHWRRFRPLLDAQPFFRLAGRLRADAYTRAHSYFRVPDLCADITAQHFSEGAREELTETVELFQFVDSAMLLVAAAQLRAFDGRVGPPAAASVQPAETTENERHVILIPYEKAPAPTRRLYDDIKRCLELPYLDLDYQAMARWPDFLRDYWQVLRPAVESPLYKESESAVRETASALVDELPGPVELTISQLQDLGMNDDDVTALVRITELMVRGMAGRLLNISIARIGLEGGTVNRGEPERAA